MYHYAKILLCGLLITLGYLTPGQSIDWVKAEIDLTDPGRTSVSLLYKIRPANEKIDYRLILMNSAEVINLAFNDGGHILPLNGQRSSSRMISGTATLKQTIDTTLVEVTYEVLSPNRLLHTVPIPHLNLKPPEAQNTAFQVKVLLPQGYDLRDTFPAIPWEECEKDRCFSLQVVPAVIKMKLKPLDGMDFSTIAVLDFLVVSLLILFSWLGWRKLKSSPS